MSANEKEIIKSEETNVVTEEQPKKRGRKPKNKSYFGKEQEEAFRKFLVCENKREKEKIFNEILYPAFCKLIECLIHRYYLFTVDETYEDTFHDTMSFLITKVTNFDVNKNCKAYSYCGTVCKNYLILRRTQSIKRRDKMLSYDTVYSKPESDDRVEEVNENIGFHNNLIEQTKAEVINILYDGVKNGTKPLTENEIKVGEALVEILTHWEDMLDDDSSRKFNKMSLLYFIKEYTLCNTTEIRNAMRIYKKLYLFNKGELLNNGC